jgi:hypothetical protein
MQIIEKTATPPKKKSVLDFLLGRLLSSDEDVKEQIRSSAGVPVDTANSELPRISRRAVRFPGR